MNWIKLCQGRDLTRQAEQPVQYRRSFSSKVYSCVSAVLAVWIAASLAAADCSRSKVAAPRLITDSSVAADLQGLADETWRQFLVVFEAWTSCFGDVHLRTTQDLEDRAAYDPVTATVTVRVPATAAMLQGGLIHEWAHHIEYQCEAHQELRPAFLAAQGLQANVPWRPGETSTVLSGNGWASIPSEQYAEATIELVLGSRQIPTAARVSPEAVQVIAAWAAGQ